MVTRHFETAHDLKSSVPMCVTRCRHELRKKIDCISYIWLSNRKVEQATNQSSIYGGVISEKFTSIKSELVVNLYGGWGRFAS